METREVNECTGCELTNDEGTKVFSYLGFGCHLLPQRLQAIPHLEQTGTALLVTTPGKSLSKSVIMHSFKTREFQKLLSVSKMFILITKV